jgi:TonB family protein
MCGSILWKAATAMKLTSLKFSLCLSLGVHAAVAAVVFCVGDERKATGVISESVITLELVEAGDAELGVLDARSDDQLSQMEAGKPAPEQAMFPEPHEILHEVEPDASADEFVVALPANKPLVEVEPVDGILRAACDDRDWDWSNGSEGVGLLTGASSSVAPTRVAARTGVGCRINPKPDYPRKARRLGQEGTVVLSLTVTEEGLPRAVSIKSSSGFPLLDHAALDAIKGWRFIPATSDGVSVTCEVELPVAFKLGR